MPYLWSLWPGGRTQSGVRSCVILSCNSSRVRVPLWGGQNTYTTIKCQLCDTMQIITPDRKKCQAITSALPHSQKQRCVWVSHRNLSIGFNWLKAVYTRRYLPVICMSKTHPSASCSLFFCALKWLICMNIQRKKMNMGYTQIQLGLNFEGWVRFWFWKAKHEKWGKLHNQRQKRNSDLTFWLVSQT